MEKDYKKLYEEVFERARKMIFNNPETSGIIKEVIPEVLEETEDERIKRLLIKGFKDYGSGDAIFSGVKCKDIISWLEKQNQSQIEEKLRPLFNIGDTIIHKELGGDYIHGPHKIVRIDMLNKKYYSEDEYSVNFSEQDDYELFFDCDHTCEYCVVERCPERKQPEGKTQSHTQESLVSKIESPNNLASIKGYVARDKDGTLRFCYHKPRRENQIEQTWWGSCDADFDIWNDTLEKPFEDLTWDDEPVEVTLVIKRIN